MHDGICQVERVSNREAYRQIVLEEEMAICEVVVAIEQALGGTTCQKIFEKSFLEEGLAGTTCQKSFETSSLEQGRAYHEVDSALGEGFEEGEPCSVLEQGTVDE